MSLLPIWYNSNGKSKKKRRAVTKHMAAELIKHEKFLREIGVDLNYKRKPTPLKTERRFVKVVEKNINEYDWSPCLARSKNLKTNSEYIIGQAYNKGNLVVLSKSESEDAKTGKRR